MISRLWWYRARSDKAHEHMRRAIELLGDDRSSEQAVRVLASGARLEAVEYKGDRALELARSIEGAADRLGLDGMRANIATTIGMARLFMGDVKGLEDMERGRELALAAGELTEASQATQNLSVQLFSMGRVERGWALSTDALAIAERAGSRTQIAFMEAVLSQRHFIHGDWDEAIAEWDRIIGDPDYAPPMWGTLLCQRALLRTARGDVDGARDDIEHALERGRLVEHFAAEARATAARVNAELGDADVARSHVRDLVATETHSPYWWAPIGPVAVELGVADAIRAKVEEYPGRSTSGLIPPVLANLQGDFETAADLYGALTFRPHEADARLRAGRKLLQHGRAEEAAAQLRAAIAFYRSVHATRYLAQAEAVLADAERGHAADPAPRTS
jgi:tetratricopeptide (TPR) repeat protein